MSSECSAYDWFVRQALEKPDLTAVATEREGDISYAMLRSAIDLCADKINLRYTLSPGQTVALECPSNLDAIVLTYALWKLKCCVMPVSTELNDAVKDASYEQFNPNAILRRVEKDRSLIHGDNISLEIRHAEDPNHIANEDSLPAFPRFTSGTTGEPKGVLLTHKNLFDRISLANARLKIGVGDTVYTSLSLSHHFAVSIVSYLTYGATILLGSHTNHAIASSRPVTIIYAAPDDYIALIKLPLDISLLRFPIATTAAVTAVLSEDVHSSWGRYLCPLYGMIEVGLPLMNLTPTRATLESVGTLTPGFEMRVQPLIDYPEYEEMLLKGPGLFSSYIGVSSSQRSISDDGFFNTHDIVRCDVNGNVWILGRSKDINSYKGQAFLAQDVERHFEEHPQVKEALLLSTSHDSHRILITLNEGESVPQLADIRSWFLERSQVKLPLSEINIVSTLPRTTTGKKLRRPEIASV